MVVQSTKIVPSNLTWASALETIGGRMVNCISDYRQKYKGKPDEEIVPFVKQLVTKRWRMVAGYVVKEVQEEEDVYKVNVLETEVQAEEIPQGPSQVVQPGIEECSCGKWQEYQYP